MGVAERERHIPGDVDGVLDRDKPVIAGLWNSEEQGLNGSRAFVADHPELDDRTPLWIGERGPLKDRSGVFYLLKRLARNAGLDPDLISPHVLRHTLATRYLEAHPDALREVDPVGAVPTADEVAAPFLAHHLLHAASRWLALLEVLEGELRVAFERGQRVLEFVVQPPQELPAVLCRPGVHSGDVLQPPPEGWSTAFSIVLPLKCR